MFASGNPALVESAMEALVRDMHDFIFLKDKDLRYVFATESFAVDCVGVKSVHDLLGKTDFEVFEDQAFAQKYREDDQHLMSGKRSLREYREEYPGKDGHQRWCLTSKIALLDDNGEALGVLGTCRDITEQVEMERANKNHLAILREQANIFAALRNSFNIILYFDLTNDKYHHVAGVGHASDAVPPEGKLSSIIEGWIVNDVALETRETCKDFFNLSTLPQRLEENSGITREVKSLKFGWMRVSILPVNRDENGRATSCLWLSQFIDEEVALRAKLENRIAVLDALRNIYRVCLFWNLNEDSYFRVSGTTFNEPSVVPDEGTLSKTLAAWIASDTSEEVGRECAEFFDLGTLPRRLGNSTVLTKEIFTKKAGWLRTSLVVVERNPDGTAATCLWVGEDINKEKQREQLHRKALFDARRAAETDALTGLTNRGAGEAQIRLQIADGVPGLMCMIDVNDFKGVNDQLGHAIGDSVLECVAKGIRSAFRQQDVVARFGGDEFLVFAANIETQRAAQHCLNRLIESVEAETASVGETQVRISAGAVIIAEGSALDFDTAYRMCDAAMYDCKDGDKGAYKLLSTTGDTLAIGSHA